MSKNELAFHGTWKSMDHTVNVNISIIIFEEDNTQIVYCPALDLSGYGSTENEAKESFKVCLDEFISYTTHKNTLARVLKEMGWTVKGKNKPMTPPTWEDVKVGNENLQHILNNYSYRIVDESVSLPAIA